MIFLGSSNPPKEIFELYLGNAMPFEEEDKTPVIPIEYKYPTFIQEDGNLLVSYPEGTEDLYFGIDHTNLVEFYSAQRPETSIVDGNLIVEV